MFIHIYMAMNIYPYFILIYGTFTVLIHISPHECPICTAAGGVFHAVELLSASLAGDRGDDPVRNYL